MTTHNIASSRIRMHYKLQNCHSVDKAATTISVWIVGSWWNGQKLDVASLQGQNNIKPTEMPWVRTPPHLLPDIQVYLTTLLFMMSHSRHILTRANCVYSWWGDGVAGGHEGTADRLCSWESVVVHVSPLCTVSSVQSHWLLVSSALCLLT